MVSWLRSAKSTAILLAVDFAERSQLQLTTQKCLQIYKKNFLKHYVFSDVLCWISLFGVDTSFTVWLKIQHLCMISMGLAQVIHDKCVVCFLFVLGPFVLFLYVYAVLFCVELCVFHVCFPFVFVWCVLCLLILFLDLCSMCYCFVGSSCWLLVCFCFVYMFYVCCCCLVFSVSALHPG